MSGIRGQGEFESGSFPRMREICFSVNPEYKPDADYVGQSLHGKLANETICRRILNLIEHRMVSTIQMPPILQMLKHGCQGLGLRAIELEHFVHETLQSFDTMALAFVLCVLSEFYRMAESVGKPRGTSR